MDDRPRQNPAYRFIDPRRSSSEVELPPEERVVAGPIPAFDTRSGGDYWLVSAGRN